MVASAYPPARPTRPIARQRRVRWRLPANTGRLVRFALVGASGVLVNTVVLFILAEAARLPYVVAAALSTETAILANFALNDRWTFRDVAPALSWAYRAARYNLVCLGGLLISVGVLAALTHWRHVHYLVANLAGVGAGLIWNYSGSSRLAWSTPRERGRSATPPPAPPTGSQPGGVPGSEPGTIGEGTRP
jgi:putative flippase GtrA